MNVNLKVLKLLQVIKEISLDFSCIISEDNADVLYFFIVYYSFLMLISFSYFIDYYYFNNYLINEIERASKFSKFQDFPQILEQFH